MIFAAAGLLLVGTAVGALVLRRSARSDAGAADATGPEALRQIRWRVETTPPGAEVVRASDGSVLGRTPWETSRPAALGQMVVSLRLPGYAERQVSLDLAADSTRSEIMLATASPPASLPPPAAESTGKKGKSRRGKAEPAGSATQSGRRLEEE